MWKKVGKSLPTSGQDEPRMVRGEGICTSDPLVPKKGLGCRSECFQALRVMLRPSQSCSLTSLSANVSPRMEVPDQGFKRITRLGLKLFCRSSAPAFGGQKPGPIAFLFLTAFSKKQ